MTIWLIEQTSKHPMRGKHRSHGTTLGNATTRGHEPFVRKSTKTLNEEEKALLESEPSSVNRVSTLRVKISMLHNTIKSIRKTHVNNTITPSHIRRSIRSKEDRQIIQLIHIAQPALRRHTRPDFLLRVQSRHPIERRIHVAGGNAIDANAMLGPFRGQRSTELDDGRFGRVVAALFLRVVDDGAGHGGDEDDGAGGAGGDHGAAAGLRDEEGARDVDVEEAAEFLRVVFFGFDVGAVVTPVNGRWSWMDFRDVLLGYSG